MSLPTPVIPAERAESPSISPNGDAESFVAFVERFKPIVFRWALGMLGSADDAEDVAQETFVIVWKHLDKVRHDKALTAWMYRVTQRAAGRLRRQSARRSVLATMPSARPERDVYTTDPGARVDRDRAIARIMDVLRTLPPRQRELFDLCDLQGLNPHEAAELIGINPVSARASLFKARTAVRRDLLRDHPRYIEESR